MPSSGMFFTPRWVYFAVIINWPASAQVDPDTVNAFAAAVTQSFVLTKDGLSS